VRSSRKFHLVRFMAVYLYTLACVAEQRSLRREDEG
jgi:hypothetical protein